MHMKSIDRRTALTYGSIGRGSSQKSDISTELCYEVREKVLEFVGAEPAY